MDEVQHFVMAELGLDLPPDVEACAEMPDALYWLMQTEQWGLLLSGQYLEQPIHFMRDVEMAKLGRNRAYAIRDANQRSRQAYEANHANQDTH